MRILFVSNCYPWPLDSGLYQRVYHIAYALARRHRVTLVAPAPRRVNGRSPDKLPLLDHCERVIEVDTHLSVMESMRRFHHWAPFPRRLQALVSSPLPCMVRQWQSNEMEQALKDIKRRETFDLVWAERPCMGELVRSAGFSKLVVDVDDMESVSLRRALKYSSWYRSKPLHYAELAKLYAYEALLPRRFWRLVVCKEEDKRLFGSDRTNVFVVPNGVPVLAPARPETERPGEMLFVGTLSYHPNVDAVEFFHQSILPQVRRLCPDAHLTVVGKEPEPAILALHDGSSCIVRGQVQDVAPHFARAALVVAPIRLGSGTRIKVLEALVRGKAVVATSTAVEGLDLRPGVDLEIADTAEAFALACVRLLGDPVARQRLGIAGRERVLQRYLWDAIGESVECVIRDYADSPAACTAETAP